MLDRRKIVKVVIGVDRRLSVIKKTSPEEVKRNDKHVESELFIIGC